MFARSRWVLGVVHHLRAPQTELYLSHNVEHVQNLLTIPHFTKYVLDPTICCAQARSAVCCTQPCVVEILDSRLSVLRSSHRGLLPAVAPGVSDKFATCPITPLFFSATAPQSPTSHCKSVAVFKQTSKCCLILPGLSGEAHAFLCGDRDCAGSTHDICEVALFFLTRGSTSTLSGLFPLEMGSTSSHDPC